MAQIVVNFRSEQQASDFIARLARVDVGEVRARILSRSDDTGGTGEESSAPMVTPEMGSVEIRPSEIPQVPEAMHEEPDEHISASVPVTGTNDTGVQVMLEMDDRHEATVRKMIEETND